MAWRLGDRPIPRKQKPRPRPPIIGRAGPGAGASERERDPGWDQPGHEIYPNTPWTPEDPPYTGPPGFENGGPTEGDPVFDFDELLRNDPRAISGKAALEEAIAAAGFARKAAIDKAILALTGTQADIGRTAGYRTGDLGADLAARGMVMSGGLGSGTQRIEEDRGRQLAAANQAAQDAQAAALSGEADVIRTSNRSYEDLLAEISAELAKDPRYHPEPEDKTDKDSGAKPPGGSKSSGSKSGGKKPPVQRGGMGPVPKNKIKARKRQLRAREKAGRM